MANAPKHKRRRTTSRSNKKSTASIAVVLIVIAVGYFSGMEPQTLLKMLGELGFPGQATETRDVTPPDHAPGRSRKGGLPESHGYTQLENCRWVEWGGNDGDSFKVRHDGDTFVFRLYFVDTPETHFRFKDRVGHQARYFNTSLDEVVEVGKEAKRFTRSVLQTKSFTVYTRWDDVMGSYRFHAFVVTPDGDFLSEELVERGLARIYTMPADLPDGTSKKVYKAKLKRIEKDAQKRRVGGWHTGR